MFDNQVVLRKRITGMHTLIKRVLLAWLQLLAIMLMVLMPLSLARAADDPEKVVARLQDALIKSMQDGSKLGYRGRFELLAPAIDHSHDMRMIGQTVLGSSWTKLEAEQQQAFIDTFRQLSIGTYASWFKEYEGERFEFSGQRAMPRGQVMVRSRMVPVSGDVVRFDYILLQGKEGWRIVNIIADGVSDLALKRVEYRAVMDRDGFAGLIDLLKKKITQTGQN